MANFPFSIYMGQGSGLVPHNFQMLPGRIAVLMDEADSRNGVLLPLSGRMTPDTGTVLASGVSSVPEGARVCTRAYNGSNLTGKWMEIEGRTVKLYGVSDYWYMDILALDPFSPTWDGVLVRREAHNTDILTTRPNWQRVGTIEAVGPCALDCVVGDRIVYSGDEMTFSFGDVSDDFCLIRSGQVQAVICD